MQKLLVIMGVLLLLNLGIVSAITPQEAGEARSLIDSKARCDTLTDEQLEIMGEYAMEQMHPGESHEAMHEMMGLKEDSETEEQFHINMAKTMYCNESAGMMGGGMMMGNNMMGSGGMGMMDQTGSMMGSWGSSYWNIMNILFIILVVGLIILVYLWIVKVWKGMKNKV